MEWFWLQVTVEGLPRASASNRGMRSSLPFSGGGAIADGADNSRLGLLQKRNCVVLEKVK